MKKIITLLIFTTLLLPIVQLNAENELEAIVINKTDTSLKVLFGDDLTNELRVYELQIRGDCLLQDFGPGYLLGVLSANETWPKAGDMIIGTANIFSDFDILSDLQTKEYSDCKILSAINKENEYYDMFYVKTTGNYEYLFESIYNNYYSVKMANDCLEKNLGQENIIIVKKLLPDMLNNAAEIISGIKVTENFNVDFITLNSCNISTAQKLSVNEGSFQETLAVYNQLIFEDKEKHATLAVTGAENCPILNYNLGNESELGLYDFGDIYYLANESNTDDQAIYINYEDIFCSVEKFRVVNDYVSPITQMVLYEAPLPLWPQPPIVNYYLQGSYQKKIYTDRPDPQTLIGHLVKGETDPATYSVDSKGELRWVRGEHVAKRLYGNDWDSQIIWFSDSIIYTYKFGESIYE